MARHSILVLTLLASAAAVRADGFIALRQANYSASDRRWIAASAPVLDRDGVTWLRGARFSAQLLAGAATPADGPLVPVGPVVDFATVDGLIPGKPGDPKVEISGVPAGQPARLQLRVWDNEGGIRGTWESARVRASSVVFLSPPLTANTTLAPVVSLPEPLRLAPAISTRSPVPARLLEVYRNQDFNPLSSGRPDFTAFVAFSRSGDRITTHRIPAYTQAPDPTHPLLGTQALGHPIGTDLLEPMPGRMSRRLPSGSSADGRTGYWNGFNEAYLLAEGKETPLPLRAVTAISRDGRHLFGWESDDDYVRLSLPDLKRTQLYPAGARPGYSVADPGADGQTVLLRRPGFAPLLWSGDAGFTVVPTPARFDAIAMAGDHRTLVGATTDTKPAWWHPDRGLVVLDGGDPTLIGSLNGVSEDGSVFFGSATGVSGTVQFWTREGAAYRLPDLLPNGVAAGLSGWGEFNVLAVSADGRLAAVAAADLGDTQPWDSILWIAELVFPGDAPRLRVQRGGGTEAEVAVLAAPGYRYQLETGTRLGIWTPAATANTSTPGWLTWPLPAAADAAFARIQADPVP